MKKFNYVSVVNFLEKIVAEKSLIFSPDRLAIGRACKLTTNQTRNNLSLGYRVNGVKFMKVLPILKDGFYLRDKLTTSFIDNGLVSINFLNVPLITYDDIYPSYRLSFEEPAKDFYKVIKNKYKMKIIKYLLNPVDSSKRESKSNADEPRREIVNLSFSIPGYMNIPKVKDMFSPTTKSEILMSKLASEDGLYNMFEFKDNELFVVVNSSRNKLLKELLVKLKKQNDEIIPRLNKYALLMRTLLNPSDPYPYFRLDIDDIEVVLNWHENSIKI